MLTWCSTANQVAVRQGPTFGTGWPFTPAARLPTMSHGSARKLMAEDRCFQPPAGAPGALFEQALEAEIAFHDAAYAD